MLFDVVLGGAVLAVDVVEEPNASDPH